MGDRYYLNLKCPFCKFINKDVWYAPNSGFLTCHCESCKREFFITSGLKPKKLKDVEYKDVYETVSQNSNFMDEEDIKRYSRQVYKGLKKKWK